MGFTYHSPSLLLLLVPHRDDQDKNGRNWGFEDAKERAANHQTSIGGASGHTGQDNSPEHHVGAQILSESTDTLGKVLGWEFSREEANVEHHCHIAEVLANEMGIGTQAHHCSVGDGRFVSKAL
jgi:hypothetical protein